MATERRPAIAPIFPADDMSAMLIRKRAGMGLARGGWFRTLKMIRDLPECAELRP